MIIDEVEHVLLWEKVKKQCRPITMEQAESYLRNIGFAVTKCTEQRKTTFSGQEHFERLRKRLYSVLELVPDEDIEQGIAELDRDFFQFKEIVEVDVSTQILIATKAAK